MLFFFYNFLMNIGEKIKGLRESRGLTQRNLALRLEISNATISRIEKNIVIPDLNTINKIANFFNVKTDYLIGKEDNLKTCKCGVKIPVLGTIPAGIPIEAVENILDFEEITEEMASKGDYFALKVKGNSMMPTILDGDVVIVKRQEDAESGKVCVVVVNGFDATLKEIKKDEQGICVLPHNPTSEFTAKFYTNEEIEKLPVKILGVAVEIRRPI